MDHRHAGPEGLDYAAGIREHVAAVIVLAQATDPTIEQLHHLRAGVDLGVQVAADRPGQSPQQGVPGPASPYIRAFVLR